MCVCGYVCQKYLIVCQKYLIVIPQKERMHKQTTKIIVYKAPVYNLFKS